MADQPASATPAPSSEPASPFEEFKAKLRQQIEDEHAAIKKRTAEAKDIAEKALLVRQFGERIKHLVERIEGLKQGEDAPASQ